MKVLPETFEEWQSCIVNDCKINMSKEFVQKRLTVYKDKENTETQKFILLYGELHHKNIINWLMQILQK